MRTAETNRVPKYGDEVYVPSLHPDGHWTNGIVNSGYAGAPHRDDMLLIAAPGHAKSNIVLAPIADYGKHWCWPEDVKRTAVGAKRANMEDLQG